MMAGAGNSARADAERAEIGLLVVDAGRSPPARAAWQRALLAQMKVELTKRGVDVANWPANAVSARSAAEQLRTGKCDAAVLVSDDRPYALRRIGGTTVATEVADKRGRQSIYLFLGEGRGQHHAVVRASFEAAVSDQAFQALLVAGSPALVQAVAR